MSKMNEISLDIQEFVNDNLEKNVLSFFVSQCLMSRKHFKCLLLLNMQKNISRRCIHD